MNLQGSLRMEVLEGISDYELQLKFNEWMEVNLVEVKTITTKIHEYRRVVHYYCFIVYLTK